MTFLHLPLSAVWVDPFHGTLSLSENLGLVVILAFQNVGKIHRCQLSY